MDKLSRQKKDILTMGDFSINLLNWNNDKNATASLGTMFSNRFHPSSLYLLGFEILQKL